MTRWPTKPLGQLVTRIKNGINLKQEVSGGGIPITRIETISDGVIDPERVRWVQPNESILAEYLLRPDDILFSHINSPAHIGKTAIYRGVPNPLVHGINLLLLRPDIEQVYPRWLLWLLKSQSSRDYFRRLCKRAVNQASLNQQDVRSLSVSVPPLAEQERIVRMLDEADELRKLRAQADRRTDALLPALFHEMFGDPEHTRLPVKQLFELVLPERPITYGILKPGPDIEDGVPYVRVLDIKQNHLHVHQLLKTSKEIADQYRRSVLRPGDILVTIRGTVGRTCIVPEELSGANITQDTARLSVVPAVETTYIIEFINTPWAQSWMSRHMLGQAVKGINLGDLRKLPIPVPSLALQKQFTQQATEIRELEAAQATSRRRLDDLFQSMLHEVFSTA